MLTLVTCYCSSGGAASSGSRSLFNMANSRVYFVSIIATMAIKVWAPHTKTNGQWIANKILQGFFGAAIESLCEISVTAIYFTHERGQYMAIYALFLAGSNFSAPIVAGFIADAQG
jgi:MFS family permease